MPEAQAPADNRQPLPIQTIGQPVAISALARLLLKMHQQRPALRLVPTEPTADEPRRPLPAKLEG